MDCSLLYRRVQKDAFDKSRLSLDRGRRGVVADQSLYSHGLQHQDDFERRRGGRGWSLGVAGSRIVGECNQFPGRAMTPAAKSMKALFWIGLAVLILGLASLVVPTSRSHETGFRAGGVSIGIETQREEKVSPILSAVMILVGAGMMIAQKVKTT